MKGQGIYAYVTLMQDIEYSPELKKELVKTVRGHIGAFAAPDVIHWAPGGSAPPPHTLPDAKMCQCMCLDITNSTLRCAKELCMLSL